MAMVLVIASQIGGGWSTVMLFAADHDKLRLFDFSFSLGEPFTFWAGLVGGAFLSLGTHGTDQMMVQRYLSARSQSGARTAVVVSGLAVFAQFALFLFIGIQLACYYDQHPTSFDSSDQVFLHFVINKFPRNTGLVGLMLAAIAAATMSTLSSSLNSSASAIVNDLMPAGMIADGTALKFRFARWLTVGFGFLQVAIGIWASCWQNAVIDNALTIAGFAFGPLLGMFALGVMTRRVGSRAAIGGSLVGLSTLLLVQFVGPKLGWRVIAFDWLACIGSITTLIAGWLLSWAWPQSCAVESHSARSNL